MKAKAQDTKLTSNNNHKPLSAYDFEPLELSEFIKQTRKLPQRPETIKVLLPENELAILAGGPFLNKSTEFQNLACAFGAGSDYHGLPVKQCRAMYVTWEGAGEKIADRFEKISKRYEMNQQPIIKLLSEPMPLNKPEGQEKMLTLIDGEVKKRGVEVVLIDNFPYTIRGNYSKDENIMQSWFEGNRRIVRETGITPIYIWVFRKLIFGGNVTEDPFSLDRLKGGSDIAYKANTVIMIGEYKKQARAKEEDGTNPSKHRSIGYYIVPKKVKDAVSDIPPLQVTLDRTLLYLKGQHWELNGNEVTAVNDPT